METAKKLLTTLFLLALTACSTFKEGGAPEPAFDINADLEKLAREFESATNISNFYSTPAAERKDTRNRFISGRLVQIDLRYLMFIRSMTADKQQLDSATDIASMTINLAGTLVTGAQAKTNLAALATGISGAKTTLDKHFYYEKSIEALIATMNAKRKEVLVNILAGLSASLEQYPFERALSDLHQYYLAGTLNGALHFINAQAAQKEASSDKALAVLYQLSVPTAADVLELGKLTDAIGANSLTLETAKKTLLAIGVQQDQLPSSLDDIGEKKGARQMLKEEVRKAKNIANDDKRAAAIKSLTDVFKAGGILP